MRVSNYVPALDGLRFIAFLLIFIHHTNTIDSVILSYIQRSGWLGVDIFFSLSAYLLTKLLRTEYNETGKIHIVNFFARRILRIWPLYFCYITFIVLLISKIRIGDDLSLYRAFGLYSFTDNFFASIYGFNSISFTGHLWTISYEEQVYMVLPFLVIFLIKSDHPPKFFIVTILTGFVIRLLFIWGNADHPLIWVLPFTHFESILVGIFLGWKKIEYNNNRYIIWIAFTLSLLTISVLPNPDNTSFFLQLLYPCIGIFSGSFLCIVLGNKSVNRILSAKLIIYLGKISFGLYIFHQICFVATDLILRKAMIVIDGASMFFSFLLTSFVASLSYFLMEKGFLKLKRRFSYIYYN